MCNKYLNFLKYNKRYLALISFKIFSLTSKTFHPSYHFLKLFWKDHLYEVWWKIWWVLEPTELKECQGFKTIMVDPVNRIHQSWHHVTSPRVKMLSQGECFGSIQEMRQLKRWGHSRATKDTWKRTSRATSESLKDEGLNIFQAVGKYLGEFMTNAFYCNFFKS